MHAHDFHLQSLNGAKVERIVKLNTQNDWFYFIKLANIGYEENLKIESTLEKLSR